MDFCSLFSSHGLCEEKAVEIIKWIINGFVFSVVVIQILLFSVCCFLSLFEIR